MLRALVEGIVAGYGIAIPVGPIGVLIVDRAVADGFARGAAAGMGTATADLIYASIAVFAGSALAGKIHSHISLLHRVAAIALGVIVVWRVATLLKRRADAVKQPRDGSPLTTYATFLGLTLLNPITIVYFASLVVGTHPLYGVGSRMVFALGAFVASASWQLSLAGFGAGVHHRLSARARLVTGFAGTAIVAALALRLAAS